MKAGKEKSINKVGKILISVILIIATIIGISATVVVIQSSKIKKDSVEPPLELSSWMNMIDDSSKINQIAIPGSHDSGTFGMPYTAETQDCSFSEQLQRGIRYFDIRVNFVNDEYVIFHGPINGVEYTEFLNDVKNFLNENPSEFIIIDYQHFKNNSQKVTFEMLEEVIGKDRIVTKRSNFSDKDFVENLTLGEVRGKCLVVSEYDGDFPFIFERGEGGALCSYYNSLEHRGNRKKFIEKTLPGYIDKFEKQGTGIFILQGQLTDLILIRGPRFLEAAHADSMNEFVQELRENKKYDKINVIMRDFVTTYTSSLTLVLNVDKGIVKEEYQESYDKMLLDSGYVAK